MSHYHRMDGHAANNAGGCRRAVVGEGEGWRDERARPSVPKTPRGSIAAAYRDRNPRLQALKP